jgi:hypothetical protein
MGLVRTLSPERGAESPPEVTGQVTHYKRLVVDQSIIGKLLDYGSVYVRRTGEGLEELHYISSPISL